MREQRILEWLVPQLPGLVGQQLAREVASEPPAEALELERQIQALEALRDPDLEAAVLQKRQRLERLLGQRSAAPELEAALADPAWWDHLTVEEVTTVLHQLVEVVLIERQQPVELRLKPRWRAGC